MSTSARDLLEPKTPAEAIATSPVDAPVQPAKLTTTTSTIAGLQLFKPSVEGFLNLFFYGDPGAGKTRLAGSSILVPEMCPVLFWDFEGGTRSLADDYGDVDVVRLTSWQKVADLYDKLFDKNPYKTLVCDSLTETQKFSMSEIMRDVVKAHPDRDPDVASLREWGKSGEQVRRLVRALRDLNCNVIFTALKADDKDDKGNVLKTKPSLPGKMSGEIAGYVDVVGYLYKKEVRKGTEVDNKTLLLTQGTEKQIAKDRSGRLPMIMDAPTMVDIYALMKGAA
jgi:AAA domain